LWGVDVTRDRLREIVDSAQEILDAGVGDNWTINDREDDPHFSCKLTFGEVRDMARELLRYGVEIK